MTGSSREQIGKIEYDLLRGLLHEECGIDLRSDKEYLFETRLASLIREYSLTGFGDLYHKAKANDPPGIRDRIVDAMTTNETLWFRDPDLFRALREELFPRWIGEIGRGSRRGVRIWSAACSTGQEPYSLAMSWLDAGGTNLPPGSLSIVATDISNPALDTARGATYAGIAIERGLDPHLRDRYFDHAQGRYRVIDEVRRLVEFRRFNLMHPFAPLGRFDLLLMRNVLIYFSEEVRRAAYRKCADALLPGGMMVIGSTESTAGYTDRFTDRKMGRSVFYAATGPAYGAAGGAGSG